MLIIEGTLFTNGNAICLMQLMLRYFHPKEVGGFSVLWFSIDQAAAIHPMTKKDIYPYVRCIRIRFLKRTDSRVYIVSVKFARLC